MKKFTKKHYKIIANLLNGQIKYLYKLEKNEKLQGTKYRINELEKVINNFSEAFKIDSNNFQPEKFINKCLTTK